MQLKKIKLEKLDISILSDRQLNQVFGGMAASQTTKTSSDNGTCSTKTSGNDSDIAGDQDLDPIIDVQL